MVTFTVTLMGIASVVGNLFIGYVIDFVRAICISSEKRGRLIPG